MSVSTSSLDSYVIGYEFQEDITELPETLRLLREMNTKINLWRTKHLRKQYERNN